MDGWLVVRIIMMMRLLQVTYFQLAIERQKGSVQGDISIKISESDWRVELRVMLNSQPAAPAYRRRRKSIEITCGGVQKILATSIHNTDFAQRCISNYLLLVNRHVVSSSRSTCGSVGIYRGNSSESAPVITTIKCAATTWIAHPHHLTRAFFSFNGWSSAVVVHGATREWLADKKISRPSTTIDRLGKCHSITW